mgnify:CR=1 FL=1
MLQSLDPEIYASQEDEVDDGDETEDVQIIEEVEVEDIDSDVDTTRVNYQLYIHGDNYTRCFLLNIHTGDMWKCNTKRGKSVFEKIQMPWNK